MRKALSSSKDTSTSLGTLWTMRRSPFSSAVKVVLHLSGRTADEVPFVPLLSYLSLLFRLGLSAFRTKLTAPILRTRDSPSRFLRDSLSISAYVDAQREPSRETLFPVEYASDIALFSEYANALSSFIRPVILAKLEKDPGTAEKLFMPLVLRGRFFSKTLVKLAIWVFRRKYAEESKKANRDVARDALEQMRKALAQCDGKHLRYLCGERFTYADIIMAESLFFDPERHGKFRYLGQDDEFADCFPDLIAWARAVRETHYPESMSATKLKH